MLLLNILCQHLRPSDIQALLLSDTVIIELSSEKETGSCRDLYYSLLFCRFVIACIFSW